MPTFVTLVRDTPESWKTVKDMPQRWDGLQKDVEKAGGKIVQCYATMGRFDFVLITEFKEARSAHKVLVQTAKRGTVLLETMPAAPMDEFLGVVKEL